MNATRIDQLLVQLNHAQSRERAKSLVKSGKVFVNGKPVTKVATQCFSDDTIEVHGGDIPWVSRAALKLEKAIELWNIDVKDLICLDIGASTGGFTEIMLSRGAKTVFALDVGHNQLAPRLCNDQRVVVMEGKNIRFAETSWFPSLFDFITVDVSFISLKYVLSKVAKLLNNGGISVVLIKPQFEVGKEQIKKGVVRDSSLHRQVVDSIWDLAIKEGLVPLYVTESPIKGGDGNKEFLLYMKK